MIESERLLAAALGELSGDEELAVEEHVVSCGACAARYASFVRLGPALAALVRDGAAAMPITRSLVERLDAEGLVSRRYVLAPGAMVPCGVGPADVYSLVVLDADLTGATRIDLIRGADRLADVPYDPTGHVYLLTPSRIVRTFPTMKLPLRLIAVDGVSERALGDYTLDHTAFAAPTTGSDTETR